MGPQLDSNLTHIKRTMILLIMQWMKPPCKKIIIKFLNMKLLKILVLRSMIMIYTRLTIQVLMTKIIGHNVVSLHLITNCRLTFGPNGCHQHATENILCWTWNFSASAHHPSLTHYKESTYMLSSFGRLCTCLTYGRLWIYHYVVYISCLFGREVSPSPLKIYVSLTLTPPLPLTPLPLIEPAPTLSTSDLVLE